MKVSLDLKCKSSLVYFSYVSLHLIFLLVVEKAIAKEEATAMDKAVERQAEKLESVANLMASEADKIIRLHKARMADYAGT